MSGRDPLSGVTPVDANGNVYALATIDYYVVGTTTRENTYTTAALTVAHSNPITLGADGRIPEIFFSQTRMKRVFKDSGGNTISGLSWDGIDKSRQRVYSETAPSPTYPGLEWVKISTNILSERNQANTAWNDRGDTDTFGAESIPVNYQTGVSYTIESDDRGELISHGNAAAVAVTLPQANSTTFGGGWHVYYSNTGAGDITITPTTSTINGAATLVLQKSRRALIVSDNTNYLALAFGPPAVEAIIIPITDDSVLVTAGTGKLTFRMPFAMTLFTGSSGVRAALVTAQTSGSILTVDINETGTTILSTKLTIDNTEKTSTTAATAAVISDTSLADDAEITIDVDQIGDGTAKGLKVMLIGYRV